MNRKRQPSAGPSSSRKPQSNVYLPKSIIILSDGEESGEEETMNNASTYVPHHRKRQKLSIDLTSADSEVDSHPRLSTLQDSAGKHGRELDRQNSVLSPGTSVGQADEATQHNSEIDDAHSNPIDIYLSRILEVVPDVVPDYARELIDKYIVESGSEVVTIIVNSLLEEHSYPRVDRKGKRKREDSRSEVGKEDVDYYSNPNRPNKAGTAYKHAALEQLKSSFPFIPITHIRNILGANNFLYAPSYLRLLKQQEEEHPPFRYKATASKVDSKGKWHDVDLEREIAWLSEYMKDERPGPNSTQQDEQDEGECEDGIECGCCFSTYRFDKMVQCPEAHLFCSNCMKSYVENKLGLHDPKINCMDQGGCKLAFSESELQRFLPSKLLDLYYRVKQTKDIEEADLEGLEECPFCEYKVVIENLEEKLFRCERDDCGVVSCRNCKKLDHLPKSCQEAEEDRGLDARHKVEEAMTEALMRNCPKCRKAFIKESGCNKMTCPNCGTMSCYNCRQIIIGYNHFDQGRGHIQRNSNKCSLWDPVEQRHDQEVQAARDKAIKDMQERNPDIEPENLRVEAPKPIAQELPRIPELAQHHVNPFQHINAALGGPAAQHLLARLNNIRAQQRQINPPALGQRVTYNMLQVGGGLLPLDQGINGMPAPMFQHMPVPQIPRFGPLFNRQLPYPHIMRHHLDFHPLPRLPLPPMQAPQGHLQANLPPNVNNDPAAANWNLLNRLEPRF